jgi:hypothetical protein
MAHGASSSRRSSATCVHRVRARLPIRVPARWLSSTRFGSSLNQHTHLHVCLIDGLFESDPLQGVRFLAAPALAAGDAETLQAKVRQRILRAFPRRGILEKDERMEMEPWEHGGGFSLDARVRIAANDRHGLERLLRYCARPPFAAERLEELDAHRLIYHLPKPGPEGRTQLILSPLELLERIAALLPPPRQHRHRFVHSVKAAGSWQENPLAWRPPTPGTAPRSPASCPARRSAGHCSGARDSGYFGYFGVGGWISCPFPAYSTLDRLIGTLRQELHEELFAGIDAALSDMQRQVLDALLDHPEGEHLNAFSRLKEAPGPPTLKHLRQWTDRLAELDAILDPRPLLADISHTKIRQFAAEAKALETGDLREVCRPGRRHTLLLCLLHQTQTETRDQLVEMFIRRMRRTRNRAVERLHAMHDNQRRIEEVLLGVFGQVLQQADATGDDRDLGRNIHQLLAEQGGVEALGAQFHAVTAFHNDNYLPLLWPIHSNHRSALFRLFDLPRK